jgi:putative lipoprotein
MRTSAVLPSLFLLLQACGGNHPPATTSTTAGTIVGDVSGTVTYREQMALPSGAVIKVQLADVSRADAPAIVISTREFAPVNQVPIPFTLTYDPRQIIAGHRYVVQARIEVDGTLRFINTSAYPVTPGRPGAIEVVVSLVGGG